jgi:hypothetical protein
MRRLAEIFCVNEAFVWFLAGARARRKAGNTLAWGRSSRQGNCGLTLVAKLWGGIEDELAECRVEKRGRCGGEEVEEVGTWQRDGKS